MKIITKEDLALAISALDKCAGEHKDDTTDTGKVRVVDLCADVATFLKQHYSE